MKRLIGAISAIVIIAGLFIQAAPAPTPSETKVNWMTWEEAQEAMKKEPRKVYVDVYTDWCGWCKRMDASTLSDPRIVNYLNKNYYSIKFNAETKETIVLNGKEYKFVANGRRGYNQLAAEILNGRMGYPASVFFNEKLEILTNVPGYQDVPTMDAILNFFGTDSYKTMDWTAYQAQFGNKTR